jgi:hypothetical protein
MRIPLRGILLLGLGALAACGAKQPTLYPNETYQRVGKAQADADIAACEAKAKEYVKSGGNDSQMAKDAARNTAGGAAVGAAGGAVGGAIGGNVGQGAAVGAASGATAGLLGTLLGNLWGGSSSGPDPVYANFVETCLREKGYQPIGWQ